MADGRRYSGAVDVTAADPDASATDFLPLDDSDSSNAQQSPLNGSDGNDSASDVSMEAQSEDEDDATLPTQHTQAALVDAAVSTASQFASNSQPDGSASRKRKSPEDPSLPGIRSNTLDPAKKLKLEQSKEDSQDTLRSATITFLWRTLPFAAHGNMAVFETPFLAKHAESSAGQNRAGHVAVVCLYYMSTLPTLAAALPFVFVTQELHVISPATMERSQAPPNTSLTKLFWSEHVEALKQEFFSVKTMGTATVEEWLKGLEGRGHERRSDALRWENWAAANGLSQMKNVLYPGYRPSAPVSSSTAAGLRTMAGSGSIVQIPGLNPAGNHSGTATPSISSSQRNGATPDPFRRSSTGTASLPSGRHERTKEEVAELKAARKAEIERRALALDPPLPPSILAHIPSFQAALQIITPLDEQAWELLKSRLLAQRADAEQREKENSAQVLRQQELDDKRNLTAAANKEARDAVDADWDEVQAPVRARIAGFADEIIRDGWENGDKVDRNSCSKFAVEVLTYIRKRFYAEVAKDAAAARASGATPIVDPPQGPFTQKLTLENMKWVFDIKIKPHTERHRKEIFLCNGCEVTVRYYGFEGVIQHYAAKHTTSLSIGNVVVHWRAEWPEQPPFTSEPRTAKNGFYQGQPPPAHNAFQQGLSSTPSQPYQAHPKGPAQPYGAAPSYGDAYPQSSHPPYPSQGYGTHPYPPPDIYQHPPYPSAQGNPPGYSGPPTAPPGPPGLPGPPAPPAPYNYNYGAYQANAQIGYQAVHPSTLSPQYQTQLEDMARIARELWNATSNMKDTLSIVRVQVVIHHLAKRFHTRFGLPLPLATFIDGLSDHKDMRPVRNVNGLVCRVCHQGIGGYVASEAERRSYSLPQLTAHFQSKHVEPFVQMGQYGQPPEWTVDMVLLPEPTAVANLRSAVSMDGQKYHLVNEVVPHLLGPVSMPEAAPNMAPVYPGQNDYHQGYQNAAVGDHATYYGQAQAGGSAEIGGANLYQNLSTTQYPHQPSAPYDHSGSSHNGVNPIGTVNGHALTEPAAPAAPAAAPAPAPAPALAPGNTALGRENERRSSQGFRQREQNSRPNKKKNRKGAHGNDTDSLKRSEEEEKMAEEEAEREGDAIRAMWAADRAQAARKSAIPESDRLEKPTADNTPSRRNTPSGTASHKASQRNAYGGNAQRPKHGSKPGTPQQRQRFQSRPRDSPSTDAASPRADVGGPNPREAAYRGHQHRLSNVIFMDGNRDEPEDYGQYNRPPSRDIEPRRSRSPVYANYSRPPAQQYRQRSPARPEHDYQYLPPAPPVDDSRYERPPPREDYSYRGYPDEPIPRQRAQEVIEIEIIEYRGPDGKTWIEERPLRRIPNPEPERYYRDALPPAAPYDRGDPYPAGPPRREQPTRPTQMLDEPYRPPFERAYSRAPQGPPPPPPAAGSYDPRHPSDAAPRHFQPQPQLPPQAPPPRDDAAYYEEEYDPRYPAGVPPPSAPIPTGSRAPRYQ
ncbi:hypothetical protein J7T55_008905 [Diaporthe amygdali]|uniref:uncharacterized protein n=1 Tax=Phomopsis amygdali TaxID=1214568 RepID=UPI0022FEDCED|nr:uncharacterized protein J7T55_008905 [Diaporthe amygdali]KAJ0121738.1 hypothetical protein J7T55_008905 [Diaporthe amygdali]